MTTSCDPKLEAEELLRRGLGRAGRRRLGGFAFLLLRRPARRRFLVHLRNLAHRVPQEPDDLAKALQPPTRYCVDGLEVGLDVDLLLDPVFDEAEVDLHRVLESRAVGHEEGDLALADDSRENIAPNRSVGLAVPARHLPRVLRVHARETDDGTLGAFPDVVEGVPLRHLEEVVEDFLPLVAVGADPTDQVVELALDEVRLEEPFLAGFALEPPLPEVMRGVPLRAVVVDHEDVARPLGRETLPLLLRFLLLVDRGLAASGVDLLEGAALFRLAEEVVRALPRERSVTHLRAELDQLLLLEAGEDAVHLGRGLGEVASEILLLLLVPLRATDFLLDRRDQLLAGAHHLDLRRDVKLVTLGCPESGRLTPLRDLLRLRAIRFLDAVAVLLLEALTNRLYVGLDIGQSHFGHTSSLKSGLENSDLPLEAALSKTIITVGMIRESALLKNSKL